MLNANPQDLPLSGHPPSWLKRNAASRWTGPLMLDAHEVLALFYAARGDGKARTRHADEVLLRLERLGLVSGEPYPEDSWKRQWRYSATEAGRAWLEGCIKDPPHE